MEKLKILTSKAAPLMLANIDTDVITPMRRLVMSTGPSLAKYAFEPLRYTGGDADTGENFGCGSSRETAVSVLVHLGYRCVIGSSFGGIFYNNCFQNGILPIVLPVEQVEALAAESLETADSDAGVTVDLEACTITTPLGNTIPFEVNGLRREALMEGLDAIGVTLKRDDAIATFQDQDRQTRPWIYHAPGQDG